MTPPTALLLDVTANDLLSVVRDAVSEAGSWSQRLDAAEKGQVDATLWRVLRDQLGVIALALPEDRGGGGATWAEVAVVLGELGRRCASVPYLGATVTAPAVLLQAGAQPLCDAAATGSALYVVAVPATQTPWDDPSYVAVEGGGKVSGRVPAVPDATLADHILIPRGDALYVVEATAPGVTRDIATSLDMTRPVSDLVFDSAPATLVVEHGARVAVQRARYLSAALLASEQVGLAWTCLDDTVSYVKQRRQFGRLIGSYQAVKHRLADLWVDLTQAAAVARHAAVTATLEGTKQFEITALHAHVYCSEVALRAAEEMMQLHGGIGFTWEHHAHLLLKRAKASQLCFGTPYLHRRRLAPLLRTSDE